MTMSKLAVVPISVTLPSLLAENQPTTALNEPYIGIIIVKLLFYFLLTSFEREKNREFSWYVYAALPLLNSKSIWAKTVRAHLVK